MKKNEHKQIKENHKSKLTSAKASYLAEQFLLDKMSFLDGDYPTKILNMYKIKGEIMAYYDLLAMIENDK